MSIIIKVIGVGNYGVDAVNYLRPHFNKFTGICFRIFDTVKQAPHPNKLQTVDSTAIDLSDSINEIIDPYANMIIVIADMGDVTSVRTVPIITKLAKDSNILTVAAVINRSQLEDTNQDVSIDELCKNVDSFIVIPNEHLKDNNKSISLPDINKAVNELLLSAVMMIFKNLTLNYYEAIHLFKNTGLAGMGVGCGKGENRALDAIKQAISCLLLSNLDIKRSKAILISVTTHPLNMYTFDELDMMINDIGNPDMDIMVVEMDSTSIAEDELVVNIIAIDLSN